ncbi:MAG: hypothetical protein L0322_28615, partial [Chloroflexi bacterium]|nr:hypothetical protein [Chloroflexota bacterium]
MNTIEKNVTSKDGTTIAFEQSGTGSAIVLVGAALTDRADTTKLARLLAQKFTVINYDRRGQGFGHLRHDHVRLGGVLFEIREDRDLHVGLADSWDMAALTCATREAGNTTDSGCSDDAAPLAAARTL